MASAAASASTHAAKGVISTFLKEAKAVGVGVVGASTNKEKFGNKVLRCYVQNGFKAYPINPNESEVEGLKSCKDIASLPSGVKCLSIITPPSAAVDIVKAATSHGGIKHLWFQPGAESDQAVKQAQSAGLSVISGGPCVLVQLGFKDH